MKIKKLLCFFLLLAVATAAFFFREPIIDWLPIDQSGWDVLENGDICYLDEDGDPVSGWLELEAGTYYFDPNTHAKHTGWLQLEEGLYYLGDDGLKRTGIQTIDGITCYLDETGLVQTGWLELDGSRMYLNDSGTPQTGWLTVDGNQYYLNAEGIMHTGWLDLDSQKYYLDETGCLRTGWLQLGSASYYLGDDGAMRTGWQTVGENRYYLNAEGIMYTGWLELDDQKYYLKEDGTAARGRYVIDDQTFYFTSTGANVILVNRWNPLSPDYEPEVTEPVHACWMEVGHCADAALAMLTDLKAAVGVTGILNGYRSYGNQYQGFYGKVQEFMDAGRSFNAACNIVMASFAVPGTSEHQLGQALDIMGHGDLYYKNENNKVLKWLKEHCWDYGFILRYPDEKSHITGIIYEPWHYRYVGVELAMELKDSGLCLEEYLDLLTGDGTTCGNPDALKQD